MIACSLSLFIGRSFKQCLPQDTVGVDTERLEAVQLNLLRLHEARPRGMHGISLDGGSASAAEREAAGQASTNVLIDQTMSCTQSVPTRHVISLCSICWFQLEGLCSGGRLCMQGKTDWCFILRRQCGTRLAKQWSVCCMIWMPM